MASTILGTGIAAALVGSVAESKYFSKYADIGAGATPFILVATGFWSIVHGVKVGAARTKYMELAKKDGEPNPEDRYGLPNLYVDGNTKNAKAFNCVQRSHQHIFESFPQLCIASLVAWMSYPIASAITTLAYSVGRYCISSDYASSEGDPAKRYSSPLARFHWYGLMATSMLGLLSAAKLSFKEKMW